MDSKNILAFIFIEKISYFYISTTKIKKSMPNTDSNIFIHNIPIKRNFIENLPYNPQLKSRARALRKAGNYPEVVYWKYVNKGKFWNIDFDRQRIIGNYIVDFYVKCLGLIIEIDGESHNEKEAYDFKREAYFRALGVRVYRISSLRVLNDLENILSELEGYIIEEYGIKSI
jgi:very-short-patch-repair endonuclease